MEEDKKEHVDLVELRQRRSRRMRLRDEILLKEEQEKKQKERKEKADRIQHSADLQRLISKLVSSKTKDFVKAAFLLGFVFVLAGGLVYWYTHPQLSEQKLRQGLPAITVGIEKKIGAPISDISVEKEKKNWRIIYRVQKGDKDFFDRTIKKACGGEVLVKVEQRLPIKELKINNVKKCR